MVISAIDSDHTIVISVIDSNHTIKGTNGWNEVVGGRTSDI